MFTYENQELVQVRKKTAGKNRDSIDGFYETNGQPKKKYFIKKPADQRELFIEGLIGRFYKELKERGLIEEKYHRSLICADFIQCEDGSYALIQPCEEFDELFKRIGSGYPDGSDRDPLYEMLCGPRIYQNITQQGQCFGLSVVLMLAILVGNYSVHSGNIVVFKNSGYRSEDGSPITQFGGIDNGAANRYFAHEENNKNILTPYEYKKGIAWLTKGYVANYREIKGLLPLIAKHATELGRSVNFNFTEIITKVFKELPPDLLKNNEKVLGELADYTCIPAFVDATFGPEGQCEEVIHKYAETLNSRLVKLGQLQENPHLANSSNSVYESFIFSGKPTVSEEDQELSLDGVLNMETFIPFPDRLSLWQRIFASAAKAPIDFTKIDYNSLARDYNDYLNTIVRQFDLYTLSSHEDGASYNSLIRPNMMM